MAYQEAGMLSLPITLFAVIRSSLLTRIHKILSEVGAGAAAGGWRWKTALGLAAQ